ncbi:MULTISPECIES: LytR/AlgR family response regulator transcription factor [Mesonia]|uniref:Transcriptional regulatory protein YpdB n=1 Tax=Mesonia oceanica TaxID=2687242 RepID=A0AC61Y5I6_9FLAO|nr:MULTISPECIES: LytTR family DNA-binding domain-containing protein [Mesonia]MAN27731.1 DNA-binding response regulator [Mesonia sp.]MAQ39666.1 DNA-binding response regulator [Mesonia sp.]VVU99573.1 Transcriptional regulatory protein YpdB [Mesonia oceanica]|tara:strand:+ start:182 stop:892 length:711 start_codon:yes stop_codon:yes gene_type:complete
MKCIIIDDEEMARAIIEQFVNNHPELSLETQFPNAIQAIKYLNQNEVDLIFLDIHMPDFTGFDLIETLKDPPKIILTTSDRNFALQAFEYDFIVDYLVKPINQERFNKAVTKAANFLIAFSSTSHTKDKKEDHEKEMYVNIDRRLVKIEFSTINLIEAKGDYILIKTTGKNYTVHSTLKKIEDKLPKDTFLKVHRSYIINVNKIVDIEDNSVLIEKEVIPVSRSNRPELMKRLNLL